MRRLVICADGTWNSADQEKGKSVTNVVKVRQAIKPKAADGTEQWVYYHEGVGTGNWVDRMTGGAFGEGLSGNVQQCYRKLVEQYRPGDEIFLFGFSRGAFTVRSLAGLIRNAGILRREEIGRVEEAYNLYRDRGDEAHPNGDKSVEFRAKYAQETDITCICVWDTVGSLGVPTRGPIGMYTRWKYGFHDVTLSGRVRNAFHALAIDERRKPFAPTLWEVKGKPADGQRVEQVWFAGVHSNVGGGYADCGLSDIALGWMMERAASCGLEFADGYLASLGGKCAGTLYDSLTATYKALGVYEREIAAPRPPKAGEPPVLTFETVHPSVLERQRTCTAPPIGPYAPANLRKYLERTAATAPAGVTPAGAGTPARVPTA